MRELPSAIWLNPSPQTSGREKIVCHRVLRVLPGRREVFDASWDGRNVIAKVFYHPLKAGRHCRREARGLRRLAERGIDAAPLLFAGRTTDGHWTVITGKIEDAVSLAEARERFGDSRDKYEVLSVAVRVLAQMHRCGVVQVDLHHANFLLQGDRLIVIDPAQIRFSRRPVGRRLGIEQLARLARILLPGELPENVEFLCEQYAQARAWQFDEAAKAAFRRVYRTDRDKGIRRSLNRLLRKDKRYVRLGQSDCYALIRKDFHEAGDSSLLLARIDTLAESGRILKNDDTTLVSHVVWAGRDLIVTRFDRAGSRWRFAERLRGSLARRRWLAGHLLAFLGVATARPLGFIERRRGAPRPRSYLLTERIEGPTLHELLCESEIPLERKRHAIRQLAEALYKLADYGITYRDPELAGIRVRGDRLVFLGLDNLVKHRFAHRHRRRCARELGRMVEALRAAGLEVQEADLGFAHGRFRSR